MVSGSRDKTALLWDVTTGRQLVAFKGHFDEIFSVAFSPDGRRLATGSNDKTVRLWDAATGQELLTLNARQRSPRSNKRGGKHLPPRKLIRPTFAGVDQL
ncbi:MAG: WD40 repeat domain-containing protein [Blastocatellia bacterium]